MTEIRGHSAGRRVWDATRAWVLVTVRPMQLFPRDAVQDQPFVTGKVGSLVWARPGWTGGGAGAASGGHTPGALSPPCLSRVCNRFTIQP